MNGENDGTVGKMPIVTRNGSTSGVSLDALPATQENQVSHLAPVACMDADVQAAFSLVFPDGHDPTHQYVLTQPRGHCLAVLGFAATLKRKKGKANKVIEYRAEVVRSCLNELRYHGAKPLGTHTAQDTANYCEALKRGPLTLPGNPPTILPQREALSVYIMGGVLDRFRHHLRGGKGVIVRSQSKPKTNGKNLDHLPNASVQALTLRCCKNAKEVGIFWLCKALVGDFSYLTRILPDDVTFHGPHRVVRIQLRDEAGVVVHVTYLTDPGASWALRRLKKEAKANEWPCLLVRVDGKTPLTVHDLSSIMGTICRHANMVTLIEANPHLKPSCKGLQDASIVEHLVAGMDSHFIASQRQMSSPQRIKEFQVALEDEEIQRQEFRSRNILVDAGLAHYKPQAWCNSCGQDVFDGACRTCRMPHLAKATQGEAKRAHLRRSFERVLDLYHRHRDNLFSNAREDLDLHWGREEAT